jgi:hypothetical protein
MKTLIPLLIVLAISSCVTQKKCNQKFPPNVVTFYKDSIVIKDSLIYKDRIVPYKIPGDTVWQEKPIPVPVELKVDPVYADNTYASAKAWIENARLKLQLTQKDQVIMFKLDSADRVAKHWESRWQNERQTITLPPVKYTPKFWIITGCLFMGSLLAVIAYIILKFFIK